MNNTLPKSSRLDDTSSLPTLELLDAQAAIPIARPIPSAAAGKAPLHNHGLTDQTNYLPTRQVIAVFAGLNLAVMVGFLDQTMYVLLMFNILIKSFTELIVVSRPPFPALLLIFIPARNLRG
jgi:hypothetical protein